MNRVDSKECFFTKYIFKSYSENSFNCRINYIYLKTPRLFIRINSVFAVPFMRSVIVNKYVIT